MLPKKNRLTTKEWDDVFKNGRRIKSSSFSLVFKKPIEKAPNKVGISVSKKVGKTAAVRNAIKRIYMAYLDDFGRKEAYTALGVIVHALPDQTLLRQGSAGQATPLHNTKVQDSLKNELEQYVAKI